MAAVGGQFEDAGMNQVSKVQGGYGIDHMILLAWNYQHLGVHLGGRLFHRTAIGRRDIIGQHGLKLANPVVGVEAAKGAGLGFLQEMRKFRSACVRHAVRGSRQGQRIALEREALSWPNVRYPILQSRITWPFSRRKSPSEAKCCLPWAINIELPRPRRMRRMMQIRLGIGFSETSEE